MPSNITSAGSASGMDFESIIAASVAAKKNQINKNVIYRKEETNIAISGVGKLKSALTDFQKALKALTEDNGFNTRKVTTNQPTENPFFTVSTKDDAADGSYDIAVKQTASNEKISQTFANGTKFEKGELTITLPEIKNDDGSTTKREFKIKVEADDTVASLRKKINNNDFGVSATLVSTDKGDKLVIDTGISGDKAEFEMSFKAEDGTADGASAELNVSTKNNTTNKVGKWDLTQGRDAIIELDGQELKSSTNEFKNVSGLTINVQRVSEKDDKGGFISNNVTVSADIDKVTEKMNGFVNAYNTLISTMDTLYEHNTYTDGQNNYDGGELAGDSMLRGLKTQVQNIMTKVKGNSSGLDIYSVGIKIDKDGTMSLDSTKFKEGIKDNFNAVVNIFASKDDKNPGVMTELNKIVDDYTKSNGLLSNREESLNMKLKDYQKEEAENATYLEEYEANLRQRYARLDTTIAGYNTSLNYLMSALG